MYAVSCCGGIKTGRIKLSPFEGTVKKGTEDEKKYGSYMFRITDLVESSGLKDLDMIHSTIAKKIDSGEGIKLFAIYDITATDVLAGYEIIQKQPI